MSRLNRCRHFRLLGCRVAHLIVTVKPGVFLQFASVQPVTFAQLHGSTQQRPTIVRALPEALKSQFKPVSLPSTVQTVQHHPIKNLQIFIAFKHLHKINKTIYTITQV